MINSKKLGTLENLIISLPICNQLWNICQNLFNLPTEYTKSVSPSQSVTESHKSLEIGLSREANYFHLTKQTETWYKACEKVHLWLLCLSWSICTAGPGTGWRRRWGSVLDITGSRQSPGTTDTVQTCSHCTLSCTLNTHRLYNLHCTHCTTRTSQNF